MKLLILYDGHSAHIGTVREYLDAFHVFSRHEIYYAIATHDATCECALDGFDAVLIHYSVRLCYSWHLSSSYAARLRDYQGLKMLTIQDEYDWTETARQWIERLGIRVVFTCVPDAYVDNVYPRQRFSGVEFLNVLTGYVPASYERPSSQVLCRPFQQRRYRLGYRGRALPFYYGHLGREKLVIAQRMREFCAAKRVACNIEWDDKHRIYGQAWHSFIQDCRAVLGTESGANVFDDSGHIRDQVNGFLQKNPNASYAEVHARFIEPFEGKVAAMNQISPRVFEAIFLKTGMVLFEGHYSGIVQPWVHYIPLKKDFANVDEVFQALENEPLLTQMVERAYSDVIESGKYSYRRLVEKIDRIMERETKPPTGGRHLPLQVLDESHGGGAIFARNRIPTRLSVTVRPLSTAERQRLTKESITARVRALLRNCGLKLRRCVQRRRPD